MRFAGALLVGVTLVAAYRPPAGDRFPVRGPNGGAILPGGRVIEPAGQQFPTGFGAFNLAISPSGRSVVTVNLSPERTSLTVLDQDRRGEWTLHNLIAASPSSKEHEFRTLSGGIAFGNDRQVWVSDGNSGQVLLIDTASGARRKALNLNGPGMEHSYPTALALNEPRNLLCVVDQAHSRVVVFETKRGEAIASIPLGYIPDSIGLSLDGQRAWVSGPGSVSAIDLAQPDKAVVKASIQIPGAGRSSVLVTEHAVYVSVTNEDTLYAIDPATQAITATISIRIPGLTELRGVFPTQMAFDQTGNRLLVSEAGLNAVGVIDTRQNVVIGHIPVGWVPQGIALRDGSVYVANAKGRGAGPSSVLVQPDGIDFAGLVGRGSVSRFPLPPPPGIAGLTKQSGRVFAADGLFPAKEDGERALPIRYVVLILKGNRTFDDILGDVKTAGTPVAGVARLAIFGSAGYANGGKGRFSLQQINVTPNQHALAEQFAFSDNFYADGEVGEESGRWVMGEYPFEPSAHSKTEGVNLFDHLQRHGISFRQFGDPADSVTPDFKMSDQHRAEQFINEIERTYRANAQPLPRFLMVRLPNDFTADPDPARGYPYRASYVADNDTALGKIVDYLSHSPWWGEMAIFVTESAATDGRDHIDAHRTILLGIGPYLKRDYVSHTNADYLALLKTMFHLLGAPSMGLSDATAADLSDLFAGAPDLKPFTFIPTDSRLFESESARGK